MKFDENIMIDIKIPTDKADEVDLMRFSMEGVEKSFSIRVPVPMSLWNRFWYRFLLGWKITTPYVQAQTVEEDEQKATI